MTTKVQLISNIVGNVSGGASFTGIVTAVSFVGNLTGTASGLSGTPNLNVGIVTATSFVGDGTDLDLSNNPTAGGSFSPVNYIIN
jgi:hypothetical protein